MADYPVTTNLRYASKALEDYLKLKEYGTFIDFETLNEIAGIDISSAKYRYVLEAAKRALLRHHDRVLISVRGKGYEIGTTEKCVVQSASYRKRSYKAAKTAFQITGTIDLSKVSPEEQIKILNEQCKAGALLVMYKASENKLINDKKEPVLLGAPTETEIVKMLLDKSKNKELV
jgi:hypothetical protein